MKKYLSLSLILVSSFLFSACSLNKNVSTESNISDSTDTNSTFSLRQLIAQNIPQKCTYTGTNQDGSFQSEIIISGDKFNQTVNYTSDSGDTGTIHTISDGEYYYTWGISQGQNFANKMKADFDSDQNEDEQNYKDEEKSFDQESYVDLDDDFQGDCSVTTVSDSDFEPPTDVEFEDYSQLIEQWQNLIPSDYDTTDLE